MKKILFNTLIIVAAIGTLFAVYDVFQIMYGRYKVSQSPGNKLIEIAEQAAKNDIWGGKTPQETYEMYLTALKSGDLDLASKYFLGIEGKANAKKWLEEKKTKGELDTYISELPKWEDMKENTEYWDKDGKEFVETKYFNQEREIVAPNGQKIIAPPGEYAVFDIVFQYNLPDKKIWKIYWR